MSLVAFLDGSASLGATAGSGLLALPMSGESGGLERELFSLTVIAAIAAAAPFQVGLLRLRVAEVVLLIGAGIVFGPEMIGWIQVDEAVRLLSELGLGFLFFLAGSELEQQAVTGRSGKLAVIGWSVSLLLAGFAVGLLQVVGIAQDFLGVAIALTSTALGTLLPVLRDSGALRTPFGTYFMGAGALGEFGPILAMAVLLGSNSSFTALVTLAVFGAIAVLLALIPRRLATDPVRELLARGHHTRSQAAVRVTMLLLLVLLTLAGHFGLDVVLGAFIAGIIMRRYESEEGDTLLQSKTEGIAFGFFVPLFFVVSGANLDVLSIVENPWRLVVFFVLLLVVRGLPQLLVYRRAVPDRTERWRLSLMIATGLPIIVAITSLQVAAGVMLPENAAALVGAGALSVLVFPLIASTLERRARTRRDDPDQRRAAATA